MIQVQMNAQQFKINLIDLIARGGLPISIFSSDEMKNMIGKMADKLKVSLDRDSLRTLVIGAAADKRDHIRKELRGIPLYMRED